MSHDDLGTIEVLDEEEFLEESQNTVDEETEKVISRPKSKQGIRRLIEDVLEEQRLRATLKAFEDSFAAE
jgi:hypothetical protein